MDYFFAQIEKFLSTTIMFDMQSSPSFSMEILMAVAFCILNILFLMEINYLAERTNAVAAEELRVRQSFILKKDFEENSRISLRRNETGANCDRNSTINSFIVPYGDFGRKTYMDDVIKERNDHVEHMLSITPSDYIRHYREKKVREEGLASCIQSLTSLLEQSLNSDEISEKLSKDAIKRSLKAIKENFQNELSDLIDFPTYNLHGLRKTSPIERNMLMLKHTTFPSLLPVAGYEELSFSFANGDSSAQRYLKGEKATPERIASIEDYFMDVEDDSMNWVVNEDIKVN